MLLAVKVLGLVVAATLSIVEKFKIAQRYRRFFAAGVVVSLLGSIAAEFIDAAEKRHDAERQATRTNELLSNIDRALHPLSPIAVSEHFEFEMTDAMFATYRARLDRAVSKRGDDEHAISVLREDSDTWPHAETDPAATSLLDVFLRGNAFFFREPRTPFDFEKQDPDLSIPVGVSDRRTIGYANGRLGFFLPDVSVNPGDMYSNGRIVSVNDLAGGVMVVRHCPFMTVFDTKHRTASGGRPPAPVRLETFSLTLPGKRELQIRREQFEVGKSSDGACDTYLYRFPSRIEDFSFVP